MGVTIDDVLARSQELGLLGPGPVAVHIDHAAAFTELLPPAATVLDLGSGGGIPGLVLCVQRPDLSVVLLDAGSRRVAFLRSAVRELTTANASVEHGRAEVLAHRDDLREQFDIVVSRSFAPPAVTAECATGFVRVGGFILVSEPLTRPDRWPAAPLAYLGLSDRGAEGTGQATIRRLEKVGSTPAEVPRGVGVPARRPLF